MKFVSLILCLGGLLTDADANTDADTNANTNAETMHDGKVMITKARLVLYQMSQKVKVT